tara:strand:- start:207 stop:740 length:534 start_codon:yes stop_codon:yes gene_type:complete
MITDRISLNLMYIHLDNFQSNQGHIYDIQIRASIKDGDISPKTIPMTNGLIDLKQFINEFAPLTGVTDISCFPLRLYELKSFKIEIKNGESNSRVNNVVNDNRNFTTTSRNIEPANLDILNKSYVPAFLEVMNAFDNLNKNEYIIDQNNYIDCAYIQVYFEKQLVNVRELYKKYKNR